MVSKKKLTVKLTMELTPEFCGDVLVTAFDGGYGGSWYWADPSGDAWPVTVSGISDDAVWHEVHIKWDFSDCPSPVMQYLYQEAYKANGYVKVDHEVVRVGLQWAIDQGRQFALEAVREMDAGEIDANAADTIVQHGLFGKEIYG